MFVKTSKNPKTLEFTALAVNYILFKILKNCWEQVLECPAAKVSFVAGH